LKVLNSRIQNMEDADKAKRFITDLLLFCSLIPVKYHKHEKKVKRQAIETISLAHALVLLVPFSAPKPQLNQCTQLQHVINFDYEHSLLTQKMLLMSLCNCKKHMRDEILSNKLFKLLLKRNDLVQWMLACSGKFEQEYLNSCVGATIVQFYLTHTKSIIGLL